MNVELGIYRAYYAQRHLAISVDDRIVDRNRIDVDKHDDLGICGKVALDLVGKFVPVVDGHAAVHLDMDARVKFFAVAVDVEIVQPDHALIAHHPVLDALDDLLVGRLAEQAAERGAKYTYARDGNQDRDDKPHHPVKVDGRKVRYDQRDYDRKRRRRVAYAVRRGSFERGRRDLFGKQSIEEEHPQLDQHRHGKHDDRRDRKFALLGRDQLADRLDRQLDRDDKHDERDDHRRDIFHSLVPVRMLFVRRLFGDLEPDHRHDIAAAVGQIVEAVRSDGQRAEQRADDYLADGKQNVEHNADRPRKRAVCSAYPGRIDVVGVFDKQFDQKSSHTSPI